MAVGYIFDVQYATQPFSKKKKKKDRVSLQNLVIDNDPQKAGNPQSRFRVSGVAQVGQWPRSVPLDRDVVLIGRPPPKNREEIFLAPVIPWELHPGSIELAQYYQNCCPLATQFHARCWDLAQHVFGPSSIEKDMDIWLEAARETYCVSGNYALKSESREYSLALTRLAISKKVNLEDFRYNPLKYAQEGVDRYIQQTGYNLPHDPINIRELSDMIEKAIQIPAKDIPEKVILRVDLPPEVKMMILDCLDTMDVRNSLSVFHWKLPDRYWRSRFPKETVFEYENLKSTNLNWEHLCLGVEDLLQTSHGLRYRKQTLRNLSDIKKLFEEKKGRRSIQMEGL